MNAVHTNKCGIQNMELKNKLECLDKKLSHSDIHSYRELKELSY